MICKDRSTLHNTTWLHNLGAFFENVLMNVGLFWYCTCIKDKLGANNNLSSWIMNRILSHYSQSCYPTWPSFGLLVKPDPKRPFSYSFQLYPKPTSMQAREKNAILYTTAIWFCLLQICHCCLYTRNVYEKECKFPCRLFYQILYTHNIIYMYVQYYIHIL